MVPPAERAIQLKVLLSQDEKKMLDSLADADGLAIADVVRMTIRRAHDERFAARKSGEQENTLRGVIEDVAGRAHYTAENIAKRTEIPLSKLLKLLRDLDTKGVLQHAAGFEGGSTWESRHVGLEATIAAATKAGFNLDKRI